MKNIDTCFAIAGLVSPIALAAATAIIAWQRPEYSHLRNTLSELGMVGAPHATWMNAAGIIPAGILVMASSLAIYRAFGKGSWSLAGSILLALGGACLAASAFSPWRGAPMDFTVLTNKLHFIFAILGFASISIAPLFFSLHARGTVAFRDWYLPSLAAAITVFIVGFWPIQGNYRGVFQRASLGIFYFWLSAICIWVLNQRLRLISR
jgi:hypothetical protein